LKINLEEVIDDTLNGNWYHYVRSDDFAWLSRPNYKNLEVNDDDIIIHKEIEEGERWPKVKYHQILDGEAFEIDGADARELLAEKLIEFINKNNKLPFACSFIQVFKNGNLKMKYAPADMDFVLKILKENVDKITKLKGDKDPDEIEKFFQGLDVDGNALDTTATSITIPKLTSAPVLEAVSLEGVKSKVYVTETEIKKIETRKSTYMGNETIYYLMETAGGMAAPDNKKSTLQREIKKAIVKCSENAMEKYSLKEGQKISFNSTFKNTKSLGCVLQNIRKFDVS
jgi:hypothetical protein